MTHVTCRLTAKLPRSVFTHRMRSTRRDRVATNLLSGQPPRPHSDVPWPVCLVCVRRIGEVCQNHWIDPSSVLAGTQMGSKTMY